MSTFKVEVVKLGPSTRHPNADTLVTTSVFGYPVIYADKEGWKEGDLAAYVPVESVVPLTPEWAFLGDSERSHRVKAKKLRGIFSMGLLTRPPAGAVEGQDVSVELGIKKYDPPVPLQLCGENELDPGFIPVYTDIEGFRRHPDLLKDGELVVLMEKIHGANLRVCFHQGRLWVGSRTCVKKENKANLWWRVVTDTIRHLPGHVFYGEVYGQVQDLKYGATKDQVFCRFFDVFSIVQGRYLNWEESKEMMLDLGFQPAPVLYEGPWSKDLLKMAEGKSTLAENVREGFVVRPLTERWDPSVGRVILKMVGEGYLLRKDGTEWH